MTKAEWTETFERTLADKTHWPLEDVREFMRQTGEDHWDALIANDACPVEAARDEYDGIADSQ